MASNPGRIRIHYRHFLRCYPAFPLFVACLPFAFIPPALIWHWAFWIGSVVGLLINYTFWRGVRWQGLYGDVNPAMVVATDPYLVAVFSDLATGREGDWPFIKILHQPLQRMAGGPPELDARLATVSTYVGSGKKPHWDDFLPWVVNCITTDEEIIRRVLVTIEEEQWQQLSDGLRQIDAPYRPGLYKIEQPSPEDEIPQPPIPRETLEKMVQRYLPHKLVGGWYLAAEEIPSKKLSNALQRYAANVREEEVLGLADATTLGSANHGLILTTEHLIFCNNRVKGRIRWRDVYEASYRGGIFPTILVTYGNANQVEVDLTGLISDFGLALERLLRRVARWNESEEG
jgi:hypothetical protein